MRAEIRKVWAASAAAACALMLLGACSKPVAEFAAGEACETDKFILEDGFDGARRGNCEIFKNGNARINIYPEDDGEINNSPWYAFRLVPKTPGVATVEIRYHNADHRYWPKVSRDGSEWQRLDAASVSESWFGSSITIKIEAGNQPIWIAAQELILPPDTDRWINGLVANNEVQSSLLGHSGAGEPIMRLDINPTSREVVFLAGRQHPPELTGALGFVAFYETILGDTDVANAFRARFHTVAIPMLNPDGVKAGHWRHNLAGADLNRDWGPFSQPETKLVQQLLDDLDAQQKRVLVSVDFHSTAKNLIYRQEDQDTTNPVDFSKLWMAAALARLPGYIFFDEPRPTSELPTSRNYMYKRYGVPAVTYEVADEEDREIIRRSAEVFAEEFMRLLNDTPIAPGAGVEHIAGSYDTDKQRH